MIYEIVLIVLIIALIRKGSLQKLSSVKIVLAHLIIIGFVIQFLARFLYHHVPFVEQTYPIWITISYLLIAWSIWSNRKLPGFLLIGMGLILNFIVITANGGYMPVSMEAIERAGLTDYIVQFDGGAKHKIIGDQTHFAYLGDIIPLKPPVTFFSIVVSPGDLLTTIGISRFVYKGMQA